MGKSWAKRFPDKLKQQKKRENERRREDLNLRNPLGVNLISSEAH